MRKLISLSCTLLVLEGCDTSPVMPSQPRSTPPGEQLFASSELDVYAWTDLKTGCQYLSTAGYQSIATVPRAGTACPNAALTGR